MLNSEQTVMNCLSMDDGDDNLWGWLIEQVDQIAIGKPYESEKILYEAPFRSSMSLKKVENRICVKMESFGYTVGYSWEMCTGPKGKYLDKFKLDE